MKNKFKFEVDGESLFCYVFLFICSIGKQILWVQPDKNFVYAWLEADVYDTTTMFQVG